VPCEGSAELADEISLALGLTGAKFDGNSSVVSSVVGPWDTTADDVPCAGGLTACLVASADSGWLGGARSDVGIGTDFCHFGYASVSVEALRFVWVTATVGWGASALVGGEGWTSGTLADVPVCCCKTGVRYDI
jgi:hypothetical protein